VPRDRGLLSNKLRSLTRVKEPELVYRLGKGDNLGYFTYISISTIARDSDASRTSSGLGLGLLLDKSFINKKKVPSNSIDYYRNR